MNDTTPRIREKAPLILAEIQKAKSILLHCHPSPDPDSVGSALAMKLALLGMGKKATVIKGDSEIPHAFMHFPGATEIVSKSFFDIDPTDFDLFIVLDSGSLQMVSRLRETGIADVLPMIVIDHHPTNEQFGMVNLVEDSYPSCTQVIYDLFREWNVEITADIARNLFIGTYTDTGGFKYGKTTAKTLSMAADLARIAPDFTGVISDMENTNTPTSIALQGLAFSSIEVFLNGHLAISLVTHQALVARGIDPKDISMGTGSISGALRSVIGWDVSIALIESEAGKVKASFRTRDAEKFDVSKLAVCFGGGGHRAAAGATLVMPFDEAKQKVVAKAKELYNL
ncbi:MAG: DHH family phosphoesterase [Patescibacteria group bacterium]